MATITLCVLILVPTQLIIQNLDINIGVTLVLNSITLFFGSNVIRAIVYKKW